MKRIEYVARSLSRSTRNVYENYTLNALYQKINNPELHIETQMSVKADDGNNYRIDMFLPQFNIAVEVFENFHNNQIEEDWKREQSIIESAAKNNISQEITFERLKINHDTTLDDLNLQIENLAKKIIKRIKINGIAPWIDDEIKLSEIIERGILEIGDALDLKNYEIVNLLLDKDIKGLQRGGYKFDNNLIWIPTISDYNDSGKTSHYGWQNFFNKNRNIIYQRHIDENEQAKIREKAPINKENKQKRIVLARERNSFGKYEKVFVGLFIADGWDSKYLAERWVRNEEKLKFPIETL